MLSQPLLHPLAVLAGGDRPEQSWAHRCQGSACTSPLLLRVSDGPILLDLVSPWVTIHPCLGQFCFLLEESPGRLVKLTQICSCPGVWSISVRNLLPWSTNLCRVIPQSSAAPLELPGQPVLLSALPVPLQEVGLNLTLPAPLHQPCTTRQPQAPHCHAWPSETLQGLRQGFS